jgi:hypothetical protein
LAVLCFSGSSSAYFLDDARRFDVRLKAYSQLSLMTEDSEELSPDQKALARSFVATGTPAQKRAAVAAITPPTYSLGDLAQHRNFYNPEFDANLTDFMQWAKADQFKFRFAWWGFYDGLYDYLNDEWADRARSYKTRFSESDNPSGESFNCNDHYKRARVLYAHQNRINELYFDYATGPFFIRVGKQASPGANPTRSRCSTFRTVRPVARRARLLQDVGGAHPALDPPVDVEADRPGRTGVEPLRRRLHGSGPIDTTVPTNPIAAGVARSTIRTTRSSTSVAQGAVASGFETLLVDKIPEKTWSNTRWGARHRTGLVLPRLHGAGLVLPHVQPGAGAARHGCIRLRSPRGADDVRRRPRPQVRPGDPRRAVCEEEPRPWAHPRAAYGIRRRPRGHVVQPAGERHPEEPRSEYFIDRRHPSP